jgi:hypothetical protein
LYLNNKKKTIQQALWISLSKLARIYLPSLKSSNKNRLLLLPSFLLIAKPNKNKLDPFKLVSLILDPLNLNQISSLFFSPFCPLLLL